jgi:C4-dicarboxylate transporter, DctM subunit
LTNVEIGLASIGFILFFIYTGMHVPLAFCLVSLLGVWAIRGNFEQASKLLALAASDAVAGYDFGVIPLFVLMGMLVSIAELGRDAFVAANAILGRIKGGLGIATVGANAVFAAVTGVSIASAAVFTKIAVPEMIRLGYRPRFAVGVVAGSSVLGMLIPPSLLLIVFGLLSEQSIGDLFIAGIVPGLLLAAAFALMIIVVATLAPSYVQAATAQAAAEAETGLLHALVRLVPLLALAALVIGGIYAGWFTPTESGAVGALGALVLAVARRKLNAASFWRVLVETGQITVSIMLLIIAANIYSRLLALSGMPATLEQWINSADLGFYALLIIYSVIIVLLGTLIDGVSIMLIMVPMFLPLVKTFGVNLVWFGIVTVLAVEIGLLTPPMGLSVYAIKSSLADPRISLNDIFIGAAPYAAVMFAVLLLIIFIPSIALVLL